MLKERTGFELREAYLDHRQEHWGFRLGRQLVIWGAADGVRITDLVSPMDMTEFLAQDYDDIRMPVNALRFFVFNDKIKLELLAVPTFEGYKLPTDAANPWSVLPKETPRSLVWDAEGSRPELRLSNVEYGGRLSFALPGVDFSLAALHTWNKMPVIEYKPSGSQLTVSPRYYRMGFVGGDVSKPLGQFVLRGEAAFNLGKHFSYIQQAASTPQKGFNTINWLVGADWYAPHEWTVMAQFSSESIFKYESYVAQPRHNSLLTLCVSKKLLDSNLQLSDFTYFDLNHKGWFSRREEMLSGRTVDLANLGSFKVVSNGKRVETEKAVTAETLKTPRIQFFPKLEMRNQAKNVQHVVIRESEAGSAKPSPNPGDLPEAPDSAL